MPVITGVRSTHIQQRVSPPEHREPAHARPASEPIAQQQSPDNPTLMEKYLAAAEEVAVVAGEVVAAK